MKLLRILPIALVALLLASPLALADTINLGGGSWANIPATSNESGTQFWANPSMDGADQNVGYLLPGFGGFPTGIGGQYLSMDWSATRPRQSRAHGVVNDVTFNSVGGSQTGSLLLEVSAYAGRNALYAYNVTDPGQRTLLFSGPAGGGTNVQVNIPYTQYGFLLIGPGGTFYSGNGPGAVSSDATSNFAFFQDPAQPGVWWMGIEDLTTCATGIERLGDYNDMIVKINTSPVPIPPTALLLGSGLLGIMVLGRRRKK
jgi:hypothetical protein